MGTCRHNFQHPAILCRIDRPPALSLQIFMPPRLLQSSVGLVLYLLIGPLLLDHILLHVSYGSESPLPPAIQVFRASDWRGATDVAFEGCKASSGEYTLWVYAKGDTCGVPREKADRVVINRQPLPGVSPIRATSRLPEGTYFVWAYGSGEPGHPWINLCAKTCVKGELPPTPGWVLLGSIDVRELHQMWLKSWEQPDGHELSIKAIVLSASDILPDWTP